MQGRTFFRIMIDKFVNNAFCKALVAVVNFCNEQSYYSQDKLKFLKKMPLHKQEQKNVYKNRYIFTSAHTSGLDFK